MVHPLTKYINFYTTDRPHCTKILSKVIHHSAEKDIPEHKIHSTDDSDCVGKHVVPHHEVGASKMGETRCANLAFVRAVASVPVSNLSTLFAEKKNWHVRDKVDTHLAFRRLDCRVGLARWDGVALAKELEVVDERLHALLHRGPRRWYELVVIDLDGTSRHFVQAL